MKMGSSAVVLEIRARSAHVRIANPPVNALSHAVRAGLMDCVGAALRDPAVDHVLILGEGRGFVAGGDIAEFDAPLQPPDMNDVLALIEGASKPVIAVLHGNVLGGGLELALACHGRVAQANARLGLPEVSLGLIPGAGGTRRLPRLIGVAPALGMILDGKPVGAEAAAALGLIDGIAEGDPVAAADALAAELAGSSLAGRRLGSRALDPTQANDAAEALAAARASVATQFPWSAARRAAIDVVAHGLDADLSDALARERAAFDACRAAPEGRALMHVFFAERAAAKPPVAAQGAAPAEIARCGVVGAGTMGRGIAIAIAAAGLDTVLFESDPQRRQPARAAIDAHFAAQAQRGRMTPDAAARAAARVSLADEIGGLGDVDLIVEAAFESMAVKREVFAALDRVARPGAILATNTSTLDIAEIARATRRPGQVLGLHFFSPAQVMRLLEIVRAPATDPAVLAAASAFARRIGKTGVVVGNAFGFVANRMIFEYQRQGEFLVEEGADPATVDRVLVEFGMPMGPFAMADLAGLDVAWRLREEIPAMRRTDRRYSRLADLVCARGWFGQKTGRGWFRYEPGGRRPLPCPDIAALIAAERARLGLSVRPIGDDEIRERCLFALVNEAARILEEGLAARPGDIDVIYIHGFGFPRWRGGPLHWADEVGVGRIADALRGWFDGGEAWLEPAPLLTRMAEAGIGFSGLERKGWIGR